MIFLQIASYRDKELNSTIQSALSKAKYPNNIAFGIVEQCASNDPLPDLPSKCEYVRTIKDSCKGVGWARNKANSLYNGEEYYLQVDSHSQFVDNWDEILINQLESLSCAKPVLTGYPSMYWYENNEVKFGQFAPNRMIATGWHPNNLLILEPRGLIDPNKSCNAFALAGGFIFAHGAFAFDVPYDSDICFLGEETVLAVHAFTRGYNLIHPTNIPLYHHYTRADAPKAWTDFPEQWNDRVNVSTNKVHAVLSGQVNNYFGNIRTLNDYQRYAGIDFNNHTILPDAKTGVREPTLNN